VRKEASEVDTDDEVVHVKDQQKLRKIGLLSSQFKEGESEKFLRFCFR
jgi:hypothetical protein